MARFWAGQADVGLAARRGIAMTFFRRCVALADRLIDPMPGTRGLPRPVTKTYEALPLPLSLPVASPQPSPALSPEQRAAVATRSRRTRIHDAFDTSMPVADRLGLAGRADELDRLLEGVLEQRKHGLVFGARGSGKTSLARVFGDIADETGCLVIYDLASGDVDFSDLMRPYLKELSGEAGSLRSSDIAAFMTGGFSARQLANLLTERIRRPTVLVIDEFDRVQSLETKRELASAMKLLSDMRSEIRIVTVGIAADLDDLIAGHPSLRRHIVSVPIGGISNRNLIDLLDRCCSRAGLTISPAASTILASAALGSPYHLRLFGLHAALEASRANLAEISEHHADAGLRAAFREWQQLSGDYASIMSNVLRSQPDIAIAVAVACLAAALRTRFSRAEVVGALADMNVAEESERRGMVDRAIDALKPLLAPEIADDRNMFADTLAPQFFVLIYSGVVDVSEGVELGTKSMFQSILQQGKV